VNILIVDQFAQLGGAQRCLIELIPAFQERNWNLRFAVAGEGPLTEYVRHCGLGIDLLPACALSSLYKPVLEQIRYSAWYSKAAWGLSRISAEFKPDLLYVNGPRVLPPAALVARARRIPLLFHAHNRVVQRTALGMLRAHLGIARARVIACCRYVASALRGQGTTVRIVYNGVPDLHVGPRLPVPDNPVIGVIGRIEPEKGQREFVQAARLLYRKCPASRFLVAGAPMSGNGGKYYKEVFEGARDIPLTFSGWNDDIREIFRQLDLLVVPSLAPEATPRVIMEAFSAGVPVIAFSSGGIPEIIRDGETGWLVHTRSPEALASRILQVFRQDYGLLGMIARNARNTWSSNFRLASYQRRICEIISEIG